MGLSLLGVALAATVNRWRYQAEQEREFARLVAVQQLSAPERQSVQRVSLDAISDAGAPADSPDGQIEPIKSVSPARETAEESRDVSVGREELPVIKDPQIVIEQPPAEIKIDAGLLGRIEIPRLGLAAMVRDGDDDATLARAVGLVRGTARPGEGGNTALAGHRDTFFRPLSEIKVDDTIRLVVPPHTYEYRVSSLRVVEPTAVDVLDSNGTEELTLVTCYPFRYVGAAPNRFIVKAIRIQ